MRDIVSSPAHFRPEVGWGETIKWRPEVGWGRDYKMAAGSGLGTRQCVTYAFAHACTGSGNNEFT